MSWVYWSVRRGIPFAKGIYLAIEARDFGFGTLHASGGILVQAGPNFYCAP